MTFNGRGRERGRDRLAVFIIKREESGGVGELPSSSLSSRGGPNLMHDYGHPKQKQRGKKRGGGERGGEA